MPFIRRHLRFIAPPAAVALIAFAAPALARTVSGHAAATSTTKCFTVTHQTQARARMPRARPARPQGRRRP